MKGMSAGAERTRETICTGKRILHHQDDRVGRARPRSRDLLDQQVAQFGISRHQRLLANVRGKLVLRHLNHLTSKFMHNQVAIRWRSVLKNKLNYIVLYV
jgi:hypothetical protein